MESFANDDVTYVDGQLNKEIVPAEIVAKGFKPPVLLPDGSIEEGDHLPANYLNYILNDIYKVIGANAYYPVSKTGSNSAGSVTYSNGDIEAWGSATTNASGVATVTYPVLFPSPAGDIQVTSIGSTNDAVTVKVSGSTTGGFTIRANDAASAVVANRGVFWRSKYRKMGA